MLDERAFARLMDEHKASVFRLAYSYLRSRADADDVVQEVFIKLYRRGRAFPSDDDARRWLLRVTVNECASLWRRLRRRPESIDDHLDALEELQASDAPDGGGQPSEDVLAAVMGLPARYRAAIYLYYYEGYSTKETARLLSVPEATARTWLARGRARLRAALANGDERRG